MRALRRGAHGRRPHRAGVDAQARPGRSPRQRLAPGPVVRADVALNRAAAAVPTTSCCVAGPICRRASKRASAPSGGCSRRSGPTRTAATSSCRGWCCSRSPRTGETAITPMTGETPVRPSQRQAGRLSYGAQRQAGRLSYGVAAALDRPRNPAPARAQAGAGRDARRAAASAPWRGRHPRRGAGRSPVGVRAWPCRTRRRPGALRRDRHSTPLADGGVDDEGRGYDRAPPLRRRRAGAAARRRAADPAGDRRGRAITSRCSPS